MPQTSNITVLLPAVPSWPFRTASARTVWEEAERLLERDPSVTLSSVLQQALWNSKVPGYEFTTEDYSILEMALRWKAITLKSAKANPLLPRGNRVLPTSLGKTQRT